MKVYIVYRQDTSHIDGRSLGCGMGSPEHWIWETLISGVRVAMDDYSTPSNAKRGFFTWREKALAELGATAWKVDKTEIEFEVIR